MKRESVIIVNHHFNEKEILESSPESSGELES